MIKVAIIVLHFGPVDLTNDCLKSLNQLIVKELSVEVIIVDASSSHNSFRIPKNINTNIIDLHHNLGYAGGNNIGIKKALENKFDYIWILNNDTEVSESSLVNLVKEMEDDKKVGAASPKIYFSPGYEYRHDKYLKDDLGKVLWWAGGKVDWNNVQTVHLGVDEVDIGQYEEKSYQETITGTAMLVRRSAIEKVGLLDENYFLYYEEGDYCQRLLRAGLKLLYVPKAIIWHKNSGSSGSGSNLHDYYLTRNRLVFGLRYASLRTKLALIRESIKHLFFGREWQKKGILDYFLGNLGRGSFPDSAEV